MNCYEWAKQSSVELVKRDQKMAVAESCTGGLIARTATMVVGSSQWFEAGFVTYSNAAKSQMLGVTEKTLSQYTAVSAQTAGEMVAGVLANSGADYAVATTGVAGPGGGTVGSPVGQVFVAVQARGQAAKTYRLQVSLDRHLLQNYITCFAYQSLLKELLLVS
jgi:nicotinamide-nucleotide amidase